MTDFVAIMAIGLLTGTFASFIGIGGGVMLTPFMLFYLNATGYTSPFLMQEIFATNMLYMVVMSGLSFWRYQKNHTFRTDQLTFLLLGAAAGGLISGLIAGELPQQWLRAFFAVLLVISAVRFLIAREKSVASGKVNQRQYKSFFTGIAGGLAGPLAGVGGGIIMLPLLAHWLKTETRKLALYSHAGISIIAAMGAIGYVISGWDKIPDQWHFGFVRLNIGLLLLAGAMPGIFLGTWLNARLSARQMQRVLGTIVLIFALYTLFL
jgi:uncharacterized membrane protein YfcA